MEKAAEATERILVCLSSSPSNHKVISAAVKMAEAFHAALTAIYVKTERYDALSDADKARLQKNTRLAEQNGAFVTTVIGNDVAVQIAEYAHISGTTKIVVGRSGTKRQHVWSKASLTEQIILNAPGLDVYIIPDSAVDLKKQTSQFRLPDQIRLTWKDSLVTLLLLLGATCIGLLFTRFGFSEANIITVFILIVLIIAATTLNPIYSAVSSLASVLLFNYFFIAPTFSFNTYEPEYAVTFGIMLISSLITSSLANKMKANARQSAREAFRAKVLFDTNQMLQKAATASDVLRITARQATALVERTAVIYARETDESLMTESIFGPSESEEGNLSPDQNEAAIAAWTYRHQQSAGVHEEQYGKSKSLYRPICINGYCYGVLCIRLGGQPMEAFSDSVLTSILGECALALESLRNAEEKEQAAIAVRNEQLRSNLLRSISHDIRTPLTSISGNASNLLSHYRQLDADTLEQAFSDIYDDSEWLINLVENLLSISRIENGQMHLHLAPEVVSDVVEEAVQHADRNASQHEIIQIAPSEEILIARMDARLITQVLINLINNAIKNTPIGSKIVIRSERTEDCIQISVSDNGPGIPDDKKPHIFEMFNTGQSKVSDGRRGLGLGLALCKSIVEAHEGTIMLTDNEPSGCRFTFTLPRREVTVHE